MAGYFPVTRLNQLNLMILVNSGKETLLELADQLHQESISIFMPTHQWGKEVNEGQDRITFKNHTQTLRLALEKRSLRSNTVNDLMQPVEALLEDDQFWRHQREGLAVFRNPNYFAVFHSPLPLVDGSRLDSHFQLRPLLPFAQPFPSYYLLQIGKNGISLYKADQFSMTAVDLAGTMPDGLEAITKYYDFEEELQGRTKGQSGMSAGYTSDDSNKGQKEKDHLLADYFRHVDRAIIQLIGTQNEPLLLASVAYYQPIYRQINAYPYLHEGGLTGNFDHMQPDEMHQMANKLLGDTFGQIRQQRIKQYQNSSGSGLVANGLQTVLEAAATGRIEVLFLQAEAEVWGQFEESTLTVNIHNEFQEGDESLLEKIALYTLRYGGEVYVLNQIELLDDQAMGTCRALCRF